MNRPFWFSSTDFCPSSKWRCKCSSSRTCRDGESIPSNRIVRNPEDNPSRSCWSPIWRCGSSTLSKCKKSKPIPSSSIFTVFYLGQSFNESHCHFASFIDSIRPWSTPKFGRIRIDITALRWRKLFPISTSYPELKEISKINDLYYNYLINGLYTCVHAVCIYFVSVPPCLL